MGKRMPLSQFVGLPGVKGGRLKGGHAKSATGFLRVLRKHRACWDAGDYGSVTAWRDDAGRYRAHRSVWMVTRAEFEGSTQCGLRKWLAEQLPLQQEPPK